LRHTRRGPLTVEPTVATAVARSAPAMASASLGPGRQRAQNRLIGIVALLATACALTVPAAAGAKVLNAPSGSVLLPSSIVAACQVLDDGTVAGAWVYCWNFSHSRHVKLTADGQFSTTATAPIPLGLGGPGDQVGTQFNVGRFRCDVLTRAVRCTVRSSGKGFLLTNNTVAGVNLATAPNQSNPVFGRTALVKPVSGTVLVKSTGSAGFTPLGATASVPLGSTIDTSNGTVQLTSAADSAGRTQTGQFHSGIFRVTQTTSTSSLPGRRRVGLTLLTLAGVASGCPAGAALRGHVAVASARRLWGDAHGNFRTRGRYASATVRGTRWLTEDTCQGTLVKVERGIVAVENLRTHRTVLVHAGSSLLSGASSSAPPSATGAIRFFGFFLNAINAHSQLVVEPAGLALFADGQWVLEGPHWTGWGSPVAHASGISSSSNGIPNAAEGMRIKTSAGVTLSSPGSFLGHRVYRCIDVAVPPPANFGGRRCLKRTGSLYIFG
jgi:hypothetical protein